MAIHKIFVEIDIYADRKKVWDYYTKPEHITHWNFASPSWCCPKVEVDFRVGGRFKSRMEPREAHANGEKGNMGFDFEGVYEEVNEYESFVYTIIDDRQVAVSFETIDNLTKVVIAFETEGGTAEQMQRDGWLAILQNFKNYTEGKA